jgi:Tol biopolymer transport system component
MTIQMRPSRPSPAIIIATAAICVLAFTPGSASATFPGQNGRIAFTGVTDPPGLGAFRFSIYTMTERGKKVRALTGARISADEPAWSANGRRIAFVRTKPGVGGKDARIGTMSAAGTRVEAVTRGRRFEGRRFRDRSPTWSPSGDRIAFVRESGGLGNTLNPTGLYSVGADGSDLRLVLSIPGVTIQDAAWSPDGARIAVSTLQTNEDGTETGGIFLVPPSGGEPTPVTTVPRSAYPDWSPDGSRIAFSRPAGGEQAFTVRVDGSELTQLTSVGTYARDPVFSPDGGTLAINERKRNLVLMPSVGGTLKPIAHLDRFDNAFEPSWQPR